MSIVKCIECQLIFLALPKLTSLLSVLFSVYYSSILFTNDVDVFARWKWAKISQIVNKNYVIKVANYRVFLSSCINNEKFRAEKFPTNNFRKRLSDPFLRAFLNLLFFSQCCLVDLVSLRPFIKVNGVLHTSKESISMNKDCQKYSRTSFQEMLNR